MTYKSRAYSAINKMKMTEATPNDMIHIDAYRKKRNYKTYYGLADDILFIEVDGKCFCKALPVNLDGEIIQKHRERYITQNSWAREQLPEIYSGIHIFLDEETTNKVAEESVKRGTYKKVEHKKGDNTDNEHRINTGSICEMAFEIFSGTKTTDFSKPSYDSQDFKVADNQELNIGVKSCEQYNGAYIIETDVKRNEILSTRIKRDIRTGSHIVCRGITSKQNLSNKLFQSRNSLIEDSICAKSVFFNTKIGFAVEQKDIDMFYSLNEINHNTNNNKLYIAKNIIIDRAVNFGCLSDEFIKTFEEEIENSDTNIVYVNVNSLGFSSLKTFAYQYEKTDSETVDAFEKFAIKYKLGVIFYDNNEMRYRTANPLIKQNYPNFDSDNYLVGKIDATGHMKRPMNGIRQGKSN